MKKKMIGLMLGMVLVLGVTACGGKDTTQSGATTNNEQQTQEQGKDVGNAVLVEATKESDAEATEEPKQEAEKQEESTEASEVEEKYELPNWKGVYDNVGRSVIGHGSFGIKIAYPSLIPASSGCAYQMDPALVLVCSPGKDENGEAIAIENIEDTLSASNRMITMYMQMYRGYDHKDFNFVVENQELLTVNDMPTCKYEGTHTYVVGGTIHEVPFVAYSFYTGQCEKYSYFTAIVIDDSENLPGMEPLAEGTIEAYAKKMVESVEIR